MGAARHGAGGDGPGLPPQEKAGDGWSGPPLGDQMVCPQG